MGSLKAPVLLSQPVPQTKDRSVATVFLVQATVKSALPTSVLSALQTTRLLMAPVNGTATRSCLVVTPALPLAAPSVLPAPQGSEQRRTRTLDAGLNVE